MEKISYKKTLFLSVIIISISINQMLSIIQSVDTYKETRSYPKIEELINDMSTKQITEIKINKESFNEQQINNFSAALKQCALLQKLDLFDNKLNEENIKTLSKALKKQKNGSLKELNLRWNPIKNNGLKRLSSIFKKSFFSKKELSIEKINLSVTYLSNGASKFLSHILTNKNLKEIDLSQNSLTNSDIKIIANILKKNNNLKYINLSINNFETEGAKALIDLLKINNNVTISLKNNDNVNSIEIIKYLKNEIFKDYLKYKTKENKEKMKKFLKRIKLPSQVYAQEPSFFF